MRHIFGLTIPYFYWDNSIPEDLRIDFLVLLNTSKELSYSGDVTKFYLAVMNNSIMNNIISLSNKYEYKSDLDINFVSPDLTDFQAKMSMLGTLASESGGRFTISQSLANENRELMNKFAKSVGKRCLRRAIKRNESKATEIKEKFLHPGGLDWEYYGIEN